MSSNVCYMFLTAWYDKHHHEGSSWEITGVLKITLQKKAFHKSFDRWKIWWKNTWSIKYLLWSPLLFIAYTKNFIIISIIIKTEEKRTELKHACHHMSTYCINIKSRIIIIIIIFHYTECVMLCSFWDT